MRMHIKRVLHPKYLLFITLAFTVLATLIFLMPSSNIPNIRINSPVGLDKLAHAAIHFALAICWLLYYTSTVGKVKVWSIVIIISVCVLYGIIIELLQGMSGSRSSELADIYANISGTSLGTLVYLVLKRKKEIKL